MGLFFQEFIIQSFDYDLNTYIFVNVIKALKFKGKISQYGELAILDMQLNITSKSITYR